MRIFNTLIVAIFIALIFIDCSTKAIKIKCFENNKIIGIYEQPASSFLSYAFYLIVEDTVAYLKNNKYKDIPPYDTLNIVKINKTLGYLDNPAPVYILCDTIDTNVCDTINPNKMNQNYSDTSQKKCIIMYKGKHALIVFKKKRAYLWLDNSESYEIRSFRLNRYRID